MRRFRCFLRGQTLSCAWVEPGATLRVRILWPPRPHILAIETGDVLWAGETSVRVAWFAPTRGKLARGGIVTTI